MDVVALLDLAARLKVPGLLLQGVDFLAAVHANAAQARHVLTAGQWDEIEAIHSRALGAADGLDHDLNAAERR